MGEDLERRGSLSYRGRNSKGVYPVQDPHTSVPYVVPEKKRISVLVPLIVVVCVVLFVITMYINNCPKNTANDKCIAQSVLHRFSFQPFSENPLLGPSSRALQQLGALDVNKIVHHGQGWRLFTCMWLHAGVFHILANMLSLLVIGIRLEQEFGFIKVGIIYLLSGLGGSLLSALFLQDRISVGASGALFGLLGAMLSELITNWSIYSNKCAALTTLVLVVAMNLAVGILPHVDNFAHIGGFVVGFLSGFVLLLRPQFGWVKKAHVPTGYAVESPRHKHKVYQYLFLLIALAILIAGFIAAAVMVSQGVDGNNECKWCHYLSCVPTSKWSCNDSGTASCNTTQTGDVLQVTCINNNKTSSTSANQSTTVLQDFCAQLCS